MSNEQEEKTALRYGALEPDDFLYRHPIRYKLMRRSGRVDAPPSRSGRRTERQHK